MTLSFTPAILQMGQFRKQILFVSAHPLVLSKRARLEEGRMNFAFSFSLVMQLEDSVLTSETIWLFICKMEESTTVSSQELNKGYRMVASYSEESTEIHDFLAITL